MKLKYTGIIEAEESPLYIGSVLVTKGTKLVPAGQVFSMEDVWDNFTAVDNEALSLMDPDRTARLCMLVVE